MSAAVATAGRDSLVHRTLDSSAAGVVDERQSLVKAAINASWWKGRCITALNDYSTIAHVRARAKWNLDSEETGYETLEAIESKLYPDLLATVAELQNVFQRVMGNYPDFASAFTEEIEKLDAACTDGKVRVTLLMQQIRFAKMIDQIYEAISLLEGSDAEDDAKGELQGILSLFPEVVESLCQLDNKADRTLIVDVLGQLEKARERANTAITDLKGSRYLDGSVQLIDEITLENYREIDFANLGDDEGIAPAAGASLHSPGASVAFGSDESDAGSDTVEAAVARTVVHIAAAVTDVSTTLLGEGAVATRTNPISTLYSTYRGDVFAAREAALARQVAARETAARESAIAREAAIVRINAEIANLDGQIKKLGPVGYIAVNKSLVASYLRHVAQLLAAGGRPQEVIQGLFTMVGTQPLDMKDQKINVKTLLCRDGGNVDSLCADVDSLVTALYSLAERFSPSIAQ